MAINVQRALLIVTVQGRVPRDVVVRRLAAFTWQRVSHVTRLGTTFAPCAPKRPKTGHVTRALSWERYEPTGNNVAGNPLQVSE